MSTQAEKVYMAASERLIEKEHEVGLENLSPDERKFFLVDQLLIEVNNGGFEQYLSNSSSSFSDETVQVLEELELYFLANLIKKAREIYNSNKPEDDKSEELEDLDHEFHDDLEYEAPYKVLLTLTNQPL